MVIWIIIGDSGLNGHWIERAQPNQPSQDELSQMDVDLRMGRHPIMGSAPTGFGGFYAYEIDTDTWKVTEA